jgi:PhzF family phenazine biosynthesis protein
VSKVVPYLLVDAFTSTPGCGNRAGVVLEAAGLSDKEMQQVAGILRVAETVFVTSQNGSDVRVRFFTPTQEVDFCGHATLAVGYVLAAERVVARGALLDTLVGTVSLDVEHEAGVVTCVWMRQPTPEYRPLPPSARESLAEALGIDARATHRALPLAAASTGLWTAFIPLIDASILDSLEPDLDAIAALSKAWGVSGIHPYAATSPSSFACRDFAPAVGIPEDPVTGSASGALAALLGRTGVLPRDDDHSEVRFVQGHALGSPGEVQVMVEYSGSRVASVRVGGCAVACYQGNLRL